MTLKAKPAQSPELSILYSQSDIESRIAEYAARIDADYLDKDPLFLFIMKGSLFFVADLLRAMETDCVMEPIRCSSYGSRGSKRGELSIRGLDELDLDGKDVLLVDDICDSGNTFQQVQEVLAEKGVRSVKTVALVKRHGKNETGFTPDYSLFEVDSDAWVVGYGFDYKERYRGLREIYLLQPPL